MQDMIYSNNNGESSQNMDVFREMAQLNSSSLSEMLFINLRDAILTGRLSPGYRFPNETEMCTVLNVGRSTLREAYVGLVIYDLVTRKKSGTFVNNINVIKNSLPFNQSLEQYEINDIMDFREMLEEEIARVAAKNAVESDIAELEKIVKKMKENIDEIVVLTICDTQFHTKIAHVSKNELLINVYAIVRKQIENIIHYAFKTNDNIRYSAITYHEKLIGALKENSSEMARQIMHDHMKNVHGIVYR